MFHKWQLARGISSPVDPREHYFQRWSGDNRIPGLEEENHLFRAFYLVFWGTANLLTLAQNLVPEFGRKKWGSWLKYERTKVLP